MPYEIENRQHSFTTENIKKLLPQPHIHPHLELIYLIKGASRATLDNKEYLIEAGDCFLAFPNQIHFYHDRDVIDGYMIIFSPDFFPKFKDLFRKKTPVSPVLHRADLPEDIEIRLKTIHEKNRTAQLYDECVKEGTLLALLGEMFPRMTFADNPTDQDSIKKILTYCVERYTEELSLEIIGKDLGFNKQYISKVFKQRMNENYKDFVNKLRVEHACDMLEKGAQVTESAYASGFSSVRTFNRAFLKYMEMSPKEYKKKKEA
ncbi:MAG: AraC family transcriptional regulator [Lachnospiraceae bacterium]|nr:AraC family transcriptional regulator [Lachnospiraceae bacterium]